MSGILSDGVERENAAAALGQFERFTPLNCFLTPHLVLVVLGKVADNDWDRQRDNQDTAHTARGTDHLIRPHNTRCNNTQCNMLFIG